MSSPLRGKAVKVFSLVSSPHIHAILSSHRILWGTVAALFPLWGVSFAFFGLRAVSTLCVAIASGVTCECLFRTALQKKIEVHDGSTVLASVLFAALLPPNVSWQTVVFGSFVTVVIGKEVFGGLGRNLFQPALVGYGTVLALFPFEFTLDRTLDSAPPWQIFFGFRSDMLGGASLLAILISGAIALAKKWIHWELPVIYLSTVALGSIFLLGKDYGHLFFNGGLFLSGFFLLGDSVTAPVTKWGRVLFAFGAGGLFLMLRLWAGYREALLSSILFMNAVVPLMDRFIHPRAKELV